jgi:hypothetical protein
MNNKQKLSEQVKIIKHQLIRERLNKTNSNYTDVSALSYELANVNFIGGGYNISTQNLQGTNSNQSFNAWENVFKKN